MPIWFEVVVLLLLAYALGLALGWLIWGRAGPGNLDEQGTLE